MRFQTGELVFYDRIGVCRVEAVGRPEIAGLPNAGDYYTLVPQHGTETILIPVETKAYLRRLLTRDEAEALLERMPELEPADCAGLDAKAVAARYQLPEPVDACEALARLVIEAYRRGQKRAEQGRRPSSADLRQRRFAETLLHGELAAALGLPAADIPALIEARFEA